LRRRCELDCRDVLYCLWRRRGVRRKATTGNHGREADADRSGKHGVAPFEFRCLKSTRSPSPAREKHDAPCITRHFIGRI
jgi:hypothetical protein